MTECWDSVPVSQGGVNREHRWEIMTDLWDGMLKIKQHREEPLKICLRVFCGQLKSCTSVGKISEDMAANGCWKAES